LALAALALVVFGAYDSYRSDTTSHGRVPQVDFMTVMLEGVFLYFHLLSSSRAEEQGGQTQGTLQDQIRVVRKALSGSGCAERLRVTGKYIGHRLVARPELDKPFRLIVPKPAIWTYFAI